MPKLTPILRKGMGWLPDRPDQRDLVRKGPPLLDRLTLPASVDLRPDMPPVYDQGQLGSCTANGWAGAYEYLGMKEGLSFEPQTPSRLFIYYNERFLEGTANYDSGAYVRDGAKVLAKQGVCDEALWPYDIGKFTELPPNSAYAAAQTHALTRYEAVPQNNANLRYVLAQRLPIVFGFTVYQSFESSDALKTGYIPMPRLSEPVLGGHCMLIVGYFKDRSRKTWYICRNSWGTDVYDGGYCYMRDIYLNNPNLADDFWVGEISS